MANHLISTSDIKRWLRYEQTAAVERWLRQHGVRSHATQADAIRSLALGAWVGGVGPYLLGAVAVVRDVLVTP